MPGRSCPSCQKRLPYAGRRCVYCGWTHRDGEDLENGKRTTRRRQVLWAAIFALFLLGGGGLLARNAAQVADWYAGFAAQHLAHPFSSFAMSPTDAGAYFYCARQVARTMSEDFSVETFAGLDESRTEVLTAGGFRIISFVEQSRADGEVVRHDFQCTVRHERGRWTMVELEMESTALVRPARAEWSAS